MSGTKKLAIGVTAYQARHSAKALRRLISRFGESMSLSAAFAKVNNALPDKERIGLKKEKKEKKIAKKTRKSVEQKAAA
jgi:cell division protein FtsX